MTPPTITAALALEILQRSGEHLLLVALSVALALLIALPLGLWVQGRPRLQRLALGAANTLQTIPSLALFGLLLTVPLLGGIGPTPAVVALTLYALLPLLRGLITGLQQVPAGLSEAGRALGLSSAQVLRHVSLPLALPSLMAGLRVATVISVGVATIAAAIGAGGLGVFIFRGIATVNNTLLLAGALPSAAIALAADAALGALETRLIRGREQPRIRTHGPAATPDRRERRPMEWWRGRRRLALLAALLVSAALGLSLTWPRLLALRPPGSVVIGAKGFTEQLLLGELLAQEIESRTALRVKREFSLGSTFLIHEAVRRGRIDGYVEYSGTAWSAILRQPDNARPASRDALLERTGRLYAERFGLRLLPSLGFENSFAMLIRRADGQRLGLRTLSQAVPAARRWRAGFGYEFLNRADGWPGLSRRYGLRLAAPASAMDLGLTYRALAGGRVDLIAGDSTNGLIPALDLQILEDDQHYFPPYDAVPVFNAASLQRHPELLPVIEGLAGRLSAATMQRLNAAVDLDKQTPEQVIRRWRRETLAAASDPQDQGQTGIRSAGADARGPAEVADAPSTPPAPADGARLRQALSQARDS
jgi:osmoprotectant transport system permease protein